MFIYSILIYIHTKIHIEINRDRDRGYTLIIIVGVFQMSHHGHYWSKDILERLDRI